MEMDSSLHIWRCLRQILFFLLRLEAQIIPMTLIHEGGGKREQKVSLGETFAGTGCPRRRRTG